MTIPENLRNPTRDKKLLNMVIERACSLRPGLGRKPVLMEVCGTHTTAVSRIGLRSLLAEVVELRSGPGCPVCVTAAGDIDAAISLSRVPNVTLATFGDMFRVPGSNSSLERESARGAQIKIVYSPIEAVNLAEASPGREIVLIGVGFETTAPLVALSMADAARRRLNNFSVFSLHKLVPPALNALLDDPELEIDGMILPGHVCTVTGRQAFSFISAKYKIPAVVTGFEVFDILGGILIILTMLENGCPRVVNGYTGVVKEEGNKEAQKIMKAFFEIDQAMWRGLGLINGSGLRLPDKWQDYNAALKFAVTSKISHEREDCRCGDVLRGRTMPIGCPLFAGACTPAHPIGPCMVSSEGACAAYYHL